MSTSRPFFGLLVRKMIGSGPPEGGVDSGVTRGTGTRFARWGVKGTVSWDQAMSAGSCTWGNEPQITLHVV